MPQVFHVQYEVRPLPGNENWSDAGGAYANCYLLAESGEEAINLARACFADNFWEIVALEESPTVVTRDRFLHDPETLECFDEAQSTGECYVYYLWPVEPGNDNALH